MNTVTGEMVWLTITLLILLMVVVILAVLVVLRRKLTRQQINSLRNMILNIHYPRPKEDRTDQPNSPQDKGSAMSDHQKKLFGRAESTKHPK